MAFSILSKKKLDVSDQETHNQWQKRYQLFPSWCLYALAPVSCSTAIQTHKER